MKIITCASYYLTGSSAVTDFVSEFSNVCNFTDSEFRFIQDPDGISDLEFNLIECFNRHNSGHAIKRYKRLVDFYNGSLFGRKYRTFFGDNWKALSNQYIEELTDFKYHGWWMYDLYDRGKIFYFRKRILNKILHMTVWKDPERCLNTMKKEITYCSHPSEEQFLNLTRKYIYNLFSSAVPKDKDTIMVDQLLPPMNLQRYLRYFDNNIKVVVVERDPRDVFVLDNYKKKSGMVPTDPELFCRWYRYTRSHRDVENLNTDQIKLIHFEDLIYDYERTTDGLQKWLELKEEKHGNKKEFFNPDKSRKNTKTWELYPQSRDAIRIIEKNLTEYLYDYS